MRKILFTGMAVFFSSLASHLIIAQAIVNPVVYETKNALYTQSFDGLPGNGSFTLTGKGPFNLENAPINSMSCNGWQVLLAGGSAAHANFGISTGSSTGSGCYSFGSSGSSDRALGTLASGTGVYATGLVLTNQTGITLNSFTVSFTAEQWRKGGSTNRNTWTFHYKTGVINHIDQTGMPDHADLNYHSVINTAGTATLNGNLPENQQQVTATVTGFNWKSGEQLLLRWDDADEPGNDDAVAIDQFSFSATQLSAAPIVTGTTVTNITPNSAVINSLVHDNYSGTTIKIDMDTLSSLATALAITPVPDSITAGTGPTAISTTLTGLKPGKTYYACVRAANGIGTACNTFSFTTGIDTIKPFITDMIPPPDKVYKANDTLHFFIRFSKKIVLNTDAGTPSLSLTIGSGSGTASYIDGRGSDVIGFRYIIQPGERSKYGIKIANAVTLNGAVITDTAGNTAKLTIPAAGILPGVLVDAIAPSFTKGALTKLILCEDSKEVPVNELLQVTDTEAGELLGWSLISDAAHGSLKGFTFTKTSNGGLFTPAGLSYTPVPGYSGSDRFSVQVSDGVNNSVIAIEVAVSKTIIDNHIAATQLVCSGQEPFMLKGSLPLAGDGAYAYTWESSNTLSETGFKTAPGIHDQQHYSPTALAKTTWFRRVVRSGNCINVSPAIQVTILNDGIWLGKTNTDWQTTTNWCGGRIPSHGTDVIIPYGTAYHPQINEAAYCNNLVIARNSSVTITGILQIKGMVNDEAQINAKNGTIAFNGNTQQMIPGKIFTDRTIKNLVVNNNAGLVLTDSLTITGSLALNSGSFETDHFLTMKNTAYIGPSAMSTVINGRITAEHTLPGGKRVFHLLGHPFSNSQSLSMLTDSMDITGEGGELNGFTGTETNEPSAFYYAGGDAGTSFDNDASWMPFTHTYGVYENEWKRYQGIRLLVRGSRGQGLDGTPAGDGNNGTYLPGAVTLSMAGPVNYGDQEIVLPNRNHSGYYLISNPYLCSIDPSLVSKSSGVGNYYWIWDTGQGLQGGYTSIPFSSPGRVEAFGAFFVKTNAGDNQVLFPENCKLSGNTLNDPAGVPDDTYHAELRLESDSIFWDRLLLFHLDSARDRTDKMDAEKLMNPDVDFYSLSKERVLLSVDARPLGSNTTIPLGIYSNTPRTFSIRIAKYHLPKQLNFLLHDKYLGQWMKIEKDSIYHFSITTDTASQGYNRFEITGIKKETAVTGTKSSLTMHINPIPATDKITVLFSAPEAGNTTLHITSLDGKLMRSLQLGMQKNGQLNIPIAGLANGIYIIELRCGDQAGVQKIIKN